MIPCSDRYQNVRFFFYSALDFKNQTTTLLSCLLYFIGKQLLLQNFTLKIRFTIQTLIDVILKVMQEDLVMGVVLLILLGLLSRGKLCKYSL